MVSHRDQGTSDGRNRIQWYQTGDQTGDQTGGQAEGRLLVEALEGWEAHRRWGDILCTCMRHPYPSSRTLHMVP